SPSSLRADLLTTWNASLTVFSCSIRAGLPNTPEWFNNHEKRRQKDGNLRSRTTFWNAKLFGFGRRVTCIATDGATTADHLPARCDGLWTSGPGNGCRLLPEASLHR